MVMVMRGGVLGGLAEAADTLATARDLKLGRAVGAFVGLLGRAPMIEAVLLVATARVDHFDGAKGHFTFAARTGVSLHRLLQQVIVLLVLANGEHARGLSPKSVVAAALDHILALFFGLHRLRSRHFNAARAHLLAKARVDGQVRLRTRRLDLVGVANGAATKMV